MEGVVARVIGAKGFGFIRGEDGEEYFFHKQEFTGFFQDLEADLEAGRIVKVTFDIVPSFKGPRAGNVVRVDGGV